jgi:hypothetical protein
VSAIYLSLKLGVSWQVRYHVIRLLVLSRVQHSVVTWFQYMVSFLSGLCLLVHKILSYIGEFNLIFLFDNYLITRSQHVFSFVPGNSGPTWLVSIVVLSLIISRGFVAIRVSEIDLILKLVVSWQVRHHVVSTISVYIVFLIVISIVFVSIPRCQS